MFAPVAVLERDRPLAAAARLLEDAGRRGGGTLLLQGHAGLGKTRLLQEISGRAAAGSGTRIVRARGRELERQFAWGGCLQLLQSALGDRPAAERDLLLSGPGAPARTLLEAPPSGTPLEVDLPLLHAVAAVLGAAAGPGRSLLLLVDDAHWLDAPSLRALHYLVGRLAGRGAVLVIARRTGEASAADAVLDALGAEPDVHVATLGPLSAAAVSALVRDTVPGADDELCLACARASRGNPFYLRQLLEELARTPGQEAAAVDDLVPATLARSVLLRIGSLGENAAALAAAVAVLADDATPAVAAALAGLTEEDALTAAGLLVRADILADRETLAFVHPLVRRAVVRDRPRAQLAREHARAAALLHANGASPEEVATQLMLAAPGPGDWAVTVLRHAAARGAARAAPASAVAYLERALAETLDATTRAAVLVELAGAESAAGVPVREHFQEALAVVTAPAERARLLQAQGWALHRSGRFSEATDAFTAGAELVPGTDLAGALDSGRLASALLSVEHRPDADRAAAALAGRPASELSPAERGLLSGVLTAQIYAAEPAAAIRTAARALDVRRVIAEETADSHTVWHLIGLLSWTDAEEVDELLAVAFEDAQGRASVLAFAMASYARSWPRLWSGRLDDAAADAQAAVDAWMHGLEMYLPAAIYWLVRAQLERGADDDAARAAGRMGEVHQMTGAMAVFPLLADGLLAAARGEHASALDLQLRAGALISGVLGAVNPSIVPWRSDAALAALALDDREQARALIAEELALAERFGTPRAHGVALRVRGLVENDLGSLERAAAMLDRDFSRLEHARALISLGGALRRAGRRADGRAQLERGLDIAHRCGARRLEALAREELLAAGGRPRRPLLSGRDALTPSERRVALLAAGGASNREIASTLFVTVSTVEWHLRNAYAKLGISSRRGLAERLDGEAGQV